MKMWKCVQNICRVSSPYVCQLRSVYLSKLCRSQTNIQPLASVPKDTQKPVASLTQFLHAYNIISNKSNYFLSKTDSVDLVSLLLQKDDDQNNIPSTKPSGNEPFEMFKQLQAFHIEKHKNLLVQLSQSVNKLSNQQILETLQKVYVLTQRKKFTSEAFTPLIGACDVELVKRMRIDLSLKESFQALDLFYVLRFHESSRFQKQASRHFATTVPRMNSQEIIQYLFFCSLNRSFPNNLDQLKLENTLKKLWDEFNLDDLAVISMAYFVSDAGFKDLDFVRKLAEAIQKEAANIEDLPLSNMLKVIRRSTVTDSFVVEETLSKMIKVLRKEIPRLNTQTSIQLMLVMTTGFNLFDPEVIEPVVCKIMTEKEKSRMKEIERAAYCLSISSLKSEKVEGFWQEFEKELLKPERANELKQHSRSLVSTLVFYTVAGYYPQKLIRFAFGRQQLQTSIEQGYRNTGRELLVIDGSVRIECPDYDGPLLSENQIKEFTPMCHPPLPNRQSKVLTFSDRFCLDLLDATSKIFSDHVVRLEYVRPHFSVPDVVVSDKSSKKVACVVVPGTRNMYLRNTTQSTGVLNAKVRQLKLLDMPVLVVPYFEYKDIDNQWNKVVFLRKKLSVLLNRKL